MTIFWAVTWVNQINFWNSEECSRYFICLKNTVKYYVHLPVVFGTMITGRSDENKDVCFVTKALGQAGAHFYFSWMEGDVNRHTSPQQFSQYLNLWNILIWKIWKSCISKQVCENPVSQSSSFTQEKRGLIIKDAIKLYCCQITKFISKYFCFLAFWTCFCAWNVQQKLCTHSHKTFQ